MHISKIHQFNQVAIKVLGKKECVASRRSFGRTHTLHPLTDEVLVPFLGIPHIKGNMSEADSIPRNGDRLLVWLEFKNFKHSTAWDTDPANLTAWLLSVHVEKRSHPIWWCVGHTHQRTPEHVPIELNRLVKIRNGNPTVTK